MDIPWVISPVQVPRRVTARARRLSVGPHQSVAARHMEELPRPRFGCAGLGLWGRAELLCMALLVQSPVGTLA